MAHLCLFALIVTFPTTHDLLHLPNKVVLDRIRNRPVRRAKRVKVHPHLIQEGVKQLMSILLIVVGKLLENASDAVFQGDGIDNVRALLASENVGE